MRPELVREQQRRLGPGLAEEVEVSAQREKMRRVAFGRKSRSAVSVVAARMRLLRRDEHRAVLRWSFRTGRGPRVHRCPPRSAAPSTSAPAAPSSSPTSRPACRNRAAKADARRWDTGAARRRLHLPRVARYPAHSVKEKTRRARLNPPRRKRTRVRWMIPRDLRMRRAAPSKRTQRRSTNSTFPSRQSPSVYRS